MLDAFGSRVGKDSEVTWLDNVCRHKWICAAIVSATCRQGVAIIGGDGLTHLLFSACLKVISHYRSGYYLNTQVCPNFIVGGDWA